MVFSLFGRRDKSDLRKGKGVFQPKIPDSTLRGPAIAPSVEQQRETARKTAEKIDRIESEMITVPVGGTAVRAAVSPAPGYAALQYCFLRCRFGDPAEIFHGSSSHRRPLARISYGACSADLD